VAKINLLHQDNLWHTGLSQEVILTTPDLSFSITLLQEGVMSYSKIWSIKANNG